MNKTIRIEGVEKFYTIGESRLHALKSVNLEVEKREFLAVLGPSGSGKSTLMNVIGCMDKADGGTYFLDDIPIHKAKEGQLTRIPQPEDRVHFPKISLDSNLQCIAKYSYAPSGTGGVLKGGRGSQPGYNPHAGTGRSDPP